MTEKKPKSAYQLYNPESKRRKRHNPLDEMYPKLPSGKYDIIYADPPWDYGGKMQFDRSAIKSHNPNFDRDVFISAATFKYPTLKTDELKELDVASISSEDSLLFMWATNPHLSQAIELGNAWGFDYKTVGFVWNKMVHNPGKYTMSYCELCLIFKRGRIPSPRGARNIKQLIEAPRGSHSEKPFQVRDNIVSMFPTQKRIELFARHREPGWDVWGLDAWDDRPFKPKDALSAAQSDQPAQLNLLSPST